MNFALRGEMFFTTYCRTCASVCAWLATRATCEVSESLMNSVVVGWPVFLGLPAQHIWGRLRGGWGRGGRRGGGGEAEGGANVIGRL